jgi:hypothetical protein
MQFKLLVMPNMRWYNANKQNPHNQLPADLLAQQQLGPASTKPIAKPHADWVVSGHAIGLVLAGVLLWQTPLTCLLSSYPTASLHRA